MVDELPPGRRAAGYAALNTLPEIASMLGPIVGTYVTTVYGMDLGMRYLFANYVASDYFNA